MDGVEVKGAFNANAQLDHTGGQREMQGRSG